MVTEERIDLIGNDGEEEVTREMSVAGLLPSWVATGVRMGGFPAVWLPLSGEGDESNARAGECAVSSLVVDWARSSTLAAAGVMIHASICHLGCLILIRSIKYNLITKLFAQMEFNSRDEYIKPN